MLAPDGAHFPAHPGVDRCGDTDLLLLRHLPGRYDVAGELQQIQVQLVQASVMPQAVLPAVAPCTDSREPSFLRCD